MIKGSVHEGELRGNLIRSGNKKTPGGCPGVFALQLHLEGDGDLVQ